MRSLTLQLMILAASVLAGCSALPDLAHQPQIHNPFPQISRVAVLPFYNQSAEPTVDGDAIALAYYNELQDIPGFEVMPVGVAKSELAKFQMTFRRIVQSGRDFQQLARYMDVDAVVVGSVTEFSPYYPPRCGLAVRWFAANPGYHPVPPGYGLPWGTSEEEFIPSSLVFDAEFALAKEQLKTQSPIMTPDVIGAAHQEIPPPTVIESSPGLLPEPPSPGLVPAEEPELLIPPPEASSDLLGPPAPQLPFDWPDPRGFVPAAPREVPPESIPQTEPVLSLTQLYRGNDAEFTRRLANYFYFRDDARFGDWQAYLQRSDDFIRFCCHLHVTELLSARGGAGKTRVVWRWPIGRYHR